MKKLCARETEIRRDAEEERERERVFVWVSPRGGGAEREVEKCPRSPDV